MPTVADAVAVLERIAPPELAEEWDNVGLLAGDPAAPLRGVMTCLTLTPDVVAEAVDAGANLVVTHHPLPFRGVKSLTTATVDGGTLWRLIGQGVAIYSPHTAYDTAAGGVNQQWAEGLGLTDIRPIEPLEDRRDGAGAGRIGLWQGSGIEALAAAIRTVANPRTLRVVDPGGPPPWRVAIACGSGGSLLEPALGAGGDLLVTGEMSFHDCLRCRSRGVGAVLTGHYASERFAVESLATRLEQGLQRLGLGAVAVAASRCESDPLRPI